MTDASDMEQDQPTEEETTDQQEPPAKEPEFKLLMVDDEVNVLNALKRVFRQVPCEITTTTNGREAIAIAKRDRPDVVICDMRMPELDGVQVLQAIDEVAPDCARIILSGYADMEKTVEAINLGHVDRYLSKPWNEEELKLVVNELVGIGRLQKERDGLAQSLAEKVYELEKINEELDQRVEMRTEELTLANKFLEQSYREMKTQFLHSIKVFSNLMELRAPSMGGHSRRVAELSRLLAREVEMEDDDVHRVYQAALLHDIGKIGLSDHTLFTPVADLDSEARSALMKHPVTAQKALLALPEMAAVATMIRHHHERYDGLGFPDGLMRDVIPLGSRVLAVAEDFDELQQGWIASKKLTPEEAMVFIQGAIGKRYDPAVVVALPAALEKLRAAPKEDEKIVSGETMKPGMIIMRDLISPEGLLLVPKEGVVTPAVVNCVMEFEAHMQHPMKVYVHKVKTASWRRRPHPEGN